MSKIFVGVDSSLIANSGQSTVWSGNTWALTEFVDTTSDQTILGNKILPGNIIIKNLWVTGTTTTINAQNLSVGSNWITINSGETGPGVTLIQSGIKVDRGTLSAYTFYFDEVSDTFKIGISGATAQSVATRQDSPTDTAIAYWNNGVYRFDTNSNLTWTGSVLKATSLSASTISATTYYGDGSKLTGISTTTTLQALTDTTIGTKVSGNTLVYSAGTWVNAMYDYNNLLNKPIGSYVNKTGDTMTGKLVLSATTGYALQVPIGNPSLGKVLTAFDSLGNTSWQNISTIVNVYWETGSTGVNSLRIVNGTNDATGDNSLSLGVGTMASGKYSLAAGDGSTADGTGSTALGYSYAQGNYSTSAGYGSFAFGDYSLAVGYINFALGNFSTAFGSSNIAEGDGSFAIGASNSTVGGGSFVGGSNSKIITGATLNGATSFVFSRSSTLSGDRSAILGGSGITGTANHTVYVPFLNLAYVPVSNSTATTILVRATDGTIQSFDRNTLLTSVTWSVISNKPTTISGYGIVDVYTTAQTNANFLSASTTFDGNFLSANTSFYTQSQANANFLSANTSFAGNFLSANTSYYTQAQANANFLSASTTFVGNFLSANTTFAGNFLTASTSLNYVSRTGDTMSGNLILPLLSATTVSATTLYGSLNWDYITNRPITLGAYGITNAYTKTETNNLFYNTAQTNANFLSANTSFYTTAQTVDNFVSASTFNSHSSDTSIHFTKSSIKLDDLGDVNTGGSIYGYVLTFSGSGWIASAVTSSGSVNLSAYYTSSQTNANFLSASTTFAGNFLSANTSYFTTAQTAANFLSASTTFVGNFLSANTSYFTTAQTAANFTSASTFNSHSSDTSIHFTKSSIKLDDLGDVNTSNTAFGYVLTFSGSGWIASAVTSSGSVNLSAYYTSSQTNANFLTASTSLNYVSRTGDTMTGTLRLPSLTATTISATTFFGNLNWSYITSKPTTVSGYGIVDVYTTAQTNANFLSASTTFSGNFLSANTSLNYVSRTGDTMTGTLRLPILTATTVTSTNLTGATLLATTISATTIKINNYTLPSASGTSGYVIMSSGSTSYWSNINSNFLSANTSLNYVARTGDTMSGDLTISTLVGTSTRTLHINSAGTLIIGDELASMFVTATTIISALELDTNWTNNTFNTTIPSGLIEGQRYVNTSYTYEYYAGSIYRNASYGGVGNTVAGSGTTLFLSRWVNSTTLGDSSISYNSVGGHLGINISGSTTNLHLHELLGGNNFIKFTLPSVGTGTTDGLDIGLSGSSKALIWNYESTSLGIATNNTEVITISANTFVGINDTTPLSNFEVNGSIGRNVNIITTATTLNNTHNIILCNNTLPFIVTLPEATAVTNRIYTIKNINTGVVTIDGAGTQTIDGVQNYYLSSQYQMINIVATGTSWYII